MRAAVIREHGDIDNILIEEDFPEPELEDGWARIAVKATSLNYHDIFSRRGMPGIKIPMPIIMGIDIAGEVVEATAVRGEHVDATATLYRVPGGIPGEC